MAMVIDQDGPLHQDEIDLTKCIAPGVYEILCTLKKRVYIGESENLLARLEKHSVSLTQNHHDCVDLQRDWNLLSLKGFQFRILCQDPVWKSLGARRKMEETVLRRREQQSFSVYNVDKEGCTRVSLEGRLFEGIGAVIAAGLTNTRFTAMGRLSSTSKK